MVTGAEGFRRCRGIAHAVPLHLMGGDVGKEVILPGQGFRQLLQIASGFRHQGVDGKVVVIALDAGNLAPPDDGHRLIVMPGPIHQIPQADDAVYLMLFDGAQHLSQNRSVAVDVGY